MPSDSDYYDAINKVRNKTAKAYEYELVQRAAKQAGAMGNAARDALNGR